MTWKQAGRTVVDEKQYGSLTIAMVDELLVNNFYRGCSAHLAKAEMKEQKCYPFAYSGLSDRYQKREGADGINHSFSYPVACCLGSPEKS